MGRRGCLILNIIIFTMILLVVVSCAAWWAVDQDRRRTDYQTPSMIGDPANQTEKPFSASQRGQHQPETGR